MSGVRQQKLSSQKRLSKSQDKRNSQQKVYNIEQNNLNGQEIQQQQIGSPQNYKQYITDLKNLASKKRKQQIVNQSFVQNQSKAAFNPISKKQPQQRKSINNPKLNTTTSGHKKLNESLRQILLLSSGNQICGILSSEETNPEVALKRIMGSVRKGDNPQQIPQPKRQRAQSAKQVGQNKRSQSNKSVNSISMGRGNQQQSQDFTKFKCYLEQLYKTNRAQDQPSKRLSFMRDDSNKKQRKGIEAQRAKSLQRMNKNDVMQGNNVNIGMSMIDQSMLQNFKQGIVQIRNEQNARSQKEQIEKKETRIKVQPASSQKPLNNNFISYPLEQTKSTDANTNGILSLDQKRYLTNQLNSNTQNSNTLYSLQYLQSQKQTTTSLNPLSNQTVLLQNNQPLKYQEGTVSESLNRADITSLNINELSNQNIIRLLQQNQMPLDLEDLHGNVVRSLQMQRKIVQEKDSMQLTNDPFQQESVQDIETQDYCYNDPTQRHQSGREKCKSRCSRRKASMSVVFLQGDEVIGFDC